MRRNLLAVGAALAFGLAFMTTGGMALGQSGKAYGAAHPFYRGGFGYPPHKGFARRKTVVFGGLGLAPYGLSWPYSGDDVPADAFGDSDGASDAAPQPPSGPVCQHSVETTTVPSEDGGTRQIKIIRCP